MGLTRNRKVLRERRHTWERGCGLLEELPFIKTLLTDLKYVLKRTRDTEEIKTLPSVTTRDSHN